MATAAGSRAGVERLHESFGVVVGGRGGPLDVTNIARDGDSLVLSFERSVRGRTIPIVLTLTVDGEMINATQNVGDGRFTVSGSGKKQ